MTDAPDTAPVDDGGSPGSPTRARERALDPGSAPIPPPRTLGGRYRLDREIGRGGMGIVYQGHDQAMDRPIAVKLLAATTAADEPAAQRFLREVKNAARLQHEHVVQVFDVGRSDEGEPFFVMELVDGQPLAALLRGGRRIAPARAVPIAIQICEALAAAHDAGIVHRDLKPANVLLVRRGDRDDFVKLIDFGISKAEGQTTAATGPGELVGTLGYMAPEQIRGEPVDGRADLYALGVMLYRMLTGTTVFDEDNLGALIHDHLSRAPDPLRARAPDAAIPAALEAVVLRCLAKQPDQRLATARDLEAALRGALAEASPFLDAVAAPEPPPAFIPPDAPPDADPDPAFELAEIAPADPVAPLPPPRRCAVCGFDNERYAKVCAGCDASLETPEQEDFRKKLATALILAEPPPPPLLASRPPAAMVVRVAPRGPVAAVLLGVPTAVWRRVAAYSALVLVLGRVFFGGLGAFFSIGLVLAVLLGLAGLWAHRREQGD